MKHIIIIIVALVSCTPIRHTQAPPPDAQRVSMKVVLLHRSSYDFYKEGYVSGGKYWYIDNNRTYPLPEGWFVWDYKTIDR